MTERRPVEMVRLEQQEEVYSVEEVFGRDASTVFPSMNQQLDPVEQLKAAIGAKKFVTETELQEIKAARGLTVDDGTIAADKPLAEVLAERKKAKQDAFDETWKQMKIGKNRPLDPDELDFLDALAQQEARQLATMQQQEAAELEAYRLAVAAAAEAKAAAAAAADAKAVGDDAEQQAAAAAAEPAAGPGPGSNSSSALGRSGSGAAAAAAKLNSKVGTKPAPVIRPVLKVKPKGAADLTAAAAAKSTGIAAAVLQHGSANKRPRLEKQQQQQQQQSAGGNGDAVGLVGLLGDYGSASDDE